MSAEDNTLIWSFGNLIASTDHMKRKSLEVLAVQDPEVGAVLRRYASTSVVAKVRKERKCFMKANI